MQTDGQDGAAGGDWLRGAKEQKCFESRKGPRRVTVTVTEGWSKAVVASARLGLGEAQSDRGETQTVCAPREVRGCCGEADA